MSKLKVLITQAVPVNNGDAALLIALYSSLIKKGYEVKIATFYYSFVKDKYPDLPFIKELTDYYFLRKLPFLKGVFLKLNFLFNNEYRNNDVFIACPGGYVNSYYQLKYALLPLFLAKKNNSKTAIYSQSIGPFNSEDTQLFVNNGRMLDLVLVRDAFSSLMMKKIKYPSNYLITKDAAFLLSKRDFNGSKSKKVAVSVREWGHDQRDMRKYISLIKGLCLKALENGFDIEFLSTCQGVKGYKNDAQLAEQIKLELVNEDPALIARVFVFSDYLNLYELMFKIQSYDFVIGTRLHMCILALVNRVPAFNVSYEVKGLECYKYLDIKEYSVDFNASTEIAENKLNQFILDIKDREEELFTTVRKVQGEVKADFGKFVQALDLPR
tara:strand:- start:1442 stop:2590 length:1149 start_codon:yes stop_codon:yes gene_type:complete